MFWITPEMAAYLQIMQAQYEANQENEQIIKTTPKTPKCSGCGKFMSLEDAHLNLMPMGYCHMSEACMENIVIKIRATFQTWDWNRQGSSMTLRREEDVQRAVVQTEAEGNREVQETEG